MRSFLKSALFVLKRKFFRPKRPFTLVAIGDSTVEGIGASKPDRSYAELVFRSIKNDLKNATFHNFGQAGAQVNDVLGIQAQKAIDLNPDLILVSIGANDIIQKRNPLQFEREYRELLHRLSKETKALIVVNNIPDITLAPAVPKMFHPYVNFAVKLFNQKIKNLTKHFGGVFVDMYQQSQFFRGYKELIAQDGFHPSDAGYALWANTIINEINPLVKKEII